MLPSNIVIYYIVCLVLCVLGSQGKPSLSFNFPSFNKVFSGFGLNNNNSNNNNNNNDDNDKSDDDNDNSDRSSGVRDERDTNLKKYSGKRVGNDTTRMVYFHDQTVAIVELGPNKLLLNCELIEVYEPEDAFKLLSNLQDISRPLLITFREMITLMSQCQEIDSQMNTNRVRSKSIQFGRGLSLNNPLTLLSGIIPGTKWCGTGDIARDYHDLGSEFHVDRCCRTHDLCPVKVRGFSKRYNLTNNSLYTKSHCKCDDDLYQCLKSTDSPTAHLMGNIYFNLIQVPCVDDDYRRRHGQQQQQQQERKFQNVKNVF